MGFTRSQLKIKERFFKTTIALIWTNSKKLRKTQKLRNGAPNGRANKNSLLFRKGKFIQKQKGSPFFLNCLLSKTRIQSKVKITFLTHHLQYSQHDIFIFQHHSVFRSLNFDVLDLERKPLSNSLFSGKKIN